MSLRTTKTHGNAGVSWPHFTIFSFRDGKWTEHCTGSIHLQYRSEGASTAEYFSHSWSDYEDAWISKEASCSLRGNPDQMYQFLRQRGIEYGPEFRRIIQFQYSDDGKTLAEVELFKRVGDGPSKSHLIHPTTLGAIMHSVFFAQSRGGSEEIGTQVPTAIESMWISCEGLDGATDESVCDDKH